MGMTELTEVKPKGAAACLGAEGYDVGLCCACSSIIYRPHLLEIQFHRHDGRHERNSSEGQAQVRNKSKPQKSRNMAL